MKKRLSLTLTALALLFTVPTSSFAQDHVIDEQAEPQFLYVISGSSGVIHGDSLTLEGVPAVLYFSDRPARIAGHLSIEEFVERWAQGSNSFAADPPNAVLSVLEGGVDDVVLELSGVNSDEAGLHFDVVPLQGVLPQETSGAASLFIDARLDGLILN